ncbi:MAG: hypothetical protein ACPGSB_04305 [Opitutales bacterium]
MKLQLVIWTLLSFCAGTSSALTHASEYSKEKEKVWYEKGQRYDGDYVALEEDGTGTSSIHIRLYVEEEKLYLWLIRITQEDLLDHPPNPIEFKYERTRTNGSYIGTGESKYIRFVTVDGAKGLVYQDRFYKLRNS